MINHILYIKPYTTGLNCGGRGGLLNCYFSTLLFQLDILVLDSRNYTLHFIVSQ